MSTNNQLEIKIEQQVGLLGWNFEELNRQLDEQLVQFDGLTFTDDQIAEAKDTRAKLNKVQKIINDRKIEVKKQFCKPYDEFAEQAKQLTDKIKNVSTKIDVQIKEYEERKKEEKRQRIEDYFNEHVENVKLDQVFDSRWLNSTYSDKQWQADIDNIATKVSEDIKTISAFENKEQMDWCLVDYLKTLDMGKTISNWQSHIAELERLEKIKADQQRRAEEEAKAKAEAEAKAKEIAESQSEVPETPVEDSKEEVPEELPTEIYTIEFEVKGTKEQMIELSEFMKTREIWFKKIQGKKEVIK